MLDYLIDIADRYLGPLVSAVVQGIAWAVAGSSPLTVLGLAATVWWTVERALHERAKRRLTEMRTDDYAEFARENNGLLRTFIDKLTGPADLKD